LTEIAVIQSKTRTVQDPAFRARWRWVPVSRPPS
jgi:hypothetical protein